MILSICHQWVILKVQNRIHNTLFHEVVHSTGHENRLNRKTVINSQKFGDALYSEEELLVEIGTSFLCCITGRL